MRVVTDGDRELLLVEVGPRVTLYTNDIVSREIDLVDRECECDPREAVIVLVGRE